jgi:hypothetical protein
MPPPPNNAMKCSMQEPNKKEAKNIRSNKKVEQNKASSRYYKSADFPFQNVVIRDREFVRLVVKNVNPLLV